MIWRVDLDALSSGGALAASFLRALALSTAFSIDLLFLLLLLRVFLPRPWLASMLAVAILVGLGLPLVHRPARAAAAGDRVGGASRVAVDAIRPARGRHARCSSTPCRSHVIASLDLSPFFGRTMVAGVLLLAAPAIVGFYVSVAGRSLVGRRFDLSDPSDAGTTRVRP